MDYIDQLKHQAREPIPSRETLSERDIWSRQGPAIYQAQRFVGTPIFYPVYRYGNYYSHSPLSLILMKGEFRVNDRVAQRAPTPDAAYYSGTETIDRDITRIGGPPTPGFTITEAGEYAQRIAEAMHRDAASIEAGHPGFTNVVLCGGKDSLNMLLLPWKNPVIVASAPPNYDLVKEFLRDNDLKLDLVRLEDNDGSLLELEILVNCLRNNLEHCRWGPQLRGISRTLNEKVVFWKGQLGSTIMSPYWKKYTHPRQTDWGWITKAFRSWGGRGEYRFNSLMEKARFTQQRFSKAMWTRGAMWQGAHVSFLRQVTNTLVLSIYHGPAMREVISQVDFHSAVRSDVRPLVGRYLRGGPVVYPTMNPGPPLSEVRKDATDLKSFLKALSLTGVRVLTD